MKKIFIIGILIFVLTGCFNNKELEENIEKKELINNGIQKLTTNERIVNREYLNEDGSVDKEKYQSFVNKRLSELQMEFKNLDKNDLIKEENKIKMNGDKGEPHEIKILNEILRLKPDIISNIDCKGFIMNTTTNYCFILKEQFKAYTNYNNISQ